MVQGAIVATLVGVMVGRANNGSTTALFRYEPYLQLIFVFPVCLLCFYAVHVREERYSRSIYFFFVYLCVCDIERERRKERESITRSIGEVLHFPNAVKLSPVLTRYYR